MTQPGQPLLHHVTFKTTRLQEMVDWYGTVVGVRPIFRAAMGAWLTNDAANHRIALISSPKLSDDPDKVVHAGMHHTAFEYASFDDLLASFSRLKALGILPHMSLDHGMTTSFYYLDPDGNSVELQYDNFGDWRASSEWMRTSDAFARNPIGVPVDPAKMVEARAAGASREELHRRAYDGQFLPTVPIDPRMPSD